jgi:type II secretory pathway component PulM
MMKKWIDDWRERSPSEQWVLASVMVMVICFLLYQLVYDPLISWRDREQRLLMGHERELVQVKGLVKRFQQQSGKPSQGAERLTSLVDTSLRKHQLTMRGIQPGKHGDVRLRLSQVSYEPLTKWLYDLEYNNQVSIEELNVSQAKTQGLLMVNIRVKK